MIQITLKFAPKIYAYFLNILGSEIFRPWNGKNTLLFHLNIFVNRTIYLWLKIYELTIWELGELTPCIYQKNWNSFNFSQTIYLFLHYNFQYIYFFIQLTKYYFFEKKSFYFKQLNYAIYHSFYLYIYITFIQRKFLNFLTLFF